MTDVSLDTQGHDVTGVPMGTLGSPMCQGVPASCVTAMATSIYPSLAAVIQSQASVCAVAKVMVAHLATVVPMVTTETPSLQKTASPVSAILMALCLRPAIRRQDSVSAERMWLVDSVTSACLTAGGMLSVRSVCHVAAALTALFPSAVMLRAAASAAQALSAGAVTCVDRVTSGGRPGDRWSAFLWRPRSRDGAGRPARGVVLGGHTGPRQGLRLTASPRAECASRVTATHLAPSHLTVMKTVSVGASRASPDPNVTAAHEGSSTSRRVAAHRVSAVMWGITVTLTQDSVSVLQTPLVRGVTAVPPTTGAMTSSLGARSVAAASSARSLSSATSTLAAASAATPSEERGATSVRLDTETSPSARSASVTSQDRTARPAIWRDKCVPAQIEQESVVASHMWKVPTVIAANQKHLACRCETRSAAASVTVTD